MKAAVLHGARDIRTETVPDPVLEPHGVIIKVNSAGICGSDLHVYKREGQEGTIFGHEFSGDVVEVNQAAADNPGLVNTEPYAGGWFYKIKLSNAAELNALLTPESYQAQIGG